MEEIIKGIKKCNTFYDFLVYIRDTDGITLITDNGYSWLEYKGEEVPNSGRERFVNQSDIDDLLQLAGL